MVTRAERSFDDTQLLHLVDEVERQVDAWISVSAAQPVDAPARRLASVLRDPRGLPFTVAFIDRVIRPEDPVVAAQAFADLAAEVPGFLPWHLRAAVRLGGPAGRLAPRLVVPVVRRVLRSMVGHLIIDARPDQLRRSIDRLRAEGTLLNLNLLGEAVLGDREAAARLRATAALLARDDVDYVSVKVSSVIGPHSPWAFEETVTHAVDALAPLFQLAAAADQPKFINLDMEEYHDLELTIEVFTRLLERPELRHLEAGIVLQAYLPDALAAMERLQHWAADRRAEGGAGIKVRVVKGANLPMERVDAVMHGWPLATWGSKQETDTSYKRVLAYALDADRVGNVRIGVAGHNLFDLAFAWVLANRRGVTDRVDFEMLLGMAPQQAEAVRRTVGGLRLYTPVVHPRDFDAAIAYLVRRLDEGANDENFMSAAFELASDGHLRRRERDRFTASLRDLDDLVPSPNRVQDRRLPPPDLAPDGQGFANAADTDPSLPGNRVWGAGILHRIEGSTLGVATVEATTIRSATELDACIAETVAAAPSWGSTAVEARAAILRRAAVELEAQRAALCEVMGAEGGKTLDQADPEVSEAVDHARYAAENAELLDRVDGATPVPVRLTVVTPPWNFPVAIPTASTVAALAAGSAVILKPAHQAGRCGAVLVEALWRAGVPREVLRIVQLEESELGARLISDPRVDRVILTGAYETAARFRSFRPDLPLVAETSGKNAIIVTPYADLDLAVKDIVRSAFGHAGQKCSAASLVVLVGSVGESPRFHRQLADAVESLVVGLPSMPAAEMGPIIEPAEGKLRRALTSLGPGESWLVEPRQLDGTGRLWSPGVRTGVARGSEFHLTEYFGPVLGIMREPTLDEAIAAVNQVDYGLTSGIHSLDTGEVDRWIETIEAGNLYVNRGITGAIVRRQPFGGWKRSAVGPCTKAGGPNQLLGLTGWATAEAASTYPIAPGIQPLLGAMVVLGRPREETAFLERALRSDEAAWAEEFGVARDVSQLGVERNIFRYVPAAAVVRHEEAAPLAHLVRVVGAAVRAGAPVRVSTGAQLPSAVARAFDRLGVPWTQEPLDQWIASPTCRLATRVRLIGESFARFTSAVDRTDLAVYAEPVTEAGRLELLPFLREQSVSITAHRFGTPDAFAEGPPSALVPPLGGGGG